MAVKSFDVLHEHQAHGRTVQALALANNLLFSASSEGDIASWSVFAGGNVKEKRRAKSAHAGERVTGLAVIRSSSLASIGFDGCLRIWTLDTLQEVAHIPTGLPASVRLFVLEASSNWLVAGSGDDGAKAGGCLSIWGIQDDSKPSGESKNHIRAHSDNVYGVALEEATQSLLWSGGRDGALQLRELSGSGEAKLLRRITVGESVRSVCVSAEAGAVWCGTKFGILNVCDLKLAKAPLTLSVHRGALYSIVCLRFQGKTVLLTSGKDFRLCSVTGSSPPGTKLRGEPGSANELFSSEPHAGRAPPFLESLCVFTPRSGPSTVLAGARDGRLVVASLSLCSGLGTPVRKRPASVMELSTTSEVSKKPASNQPSPAAAPAAGPLRRMGSAVVSWISGARWDPTPTEKAETQVKSTAEPKSKVQIRTQIKAKAKTKGKAKAKAKVTAKAMRPGKGRAQ